MSMELHMSAFPLSVSPPRGNRLQPMMASDRRWIVEAPAGFFDPARPAKKWLVFRCPAGFNEYVAALRSHGLTVTFDGPFKAVYVRPEDVQKRHDAARLAGAVFFQAGVVAPPESLILETRPVSAGG